MTAALVRKLLRDVRVALVVVGLLLGAFQVLWAKVVERIVGQLAPFFNALASAGGLSHRDIEGVIFEGPGRILRTLLGGEQIDMERAMDLLSIGYVHPLIQTLFCIWAVGRASGAVAGEIDRGTMELLQSQPLARFRLILAHFCVDLITIPTLCLALWAGNFVGAYLISPIKLKEGPVPQLTRRDYLIELGPLSLRVADPRGEAKAAPLNDEAARQRSEERLRVDPWAFGPALWSVGGLVFAVSGMTLWLSSAGRYRSRVLGLAVLGVLMQFLCNLIGQLYDALAFVRPLTIFYYYQPQQIIQGKAWTVGLSEWNGGEPLAAVPVLAVLYGVGAFGYLMALWTFQRRDLPAPL